MDSKDKYIVVTGGAGFIGSHTVVALFSKGYTPIIIDDFRNSNIDVIARLGEITQREIIYFNTACQDQARLRGIFSRFSVEGVIHFAADKAVGESVENPLKYFDNNLGSLISILDIIKEFKVKNFVFSSSCTVYGDPKTVPVTEESPTSYNSPYGYTKKVGEEMIEQMCAIHPLFTTTILRYFNPIGAHESGLIGEEPYGKPNNLLPFITQTALGVQKELTVFGDDYNTSDGTCIRDYIHVSDLADAHVAALEDTDYHMSAPKTFNIGTGKGTSVLEMIRIFEECSGKKLTYKIGPRRKGDIPEIYASTEKANQELKWKAQRSIKEAIASAWKFEQFIRSKRNQK